MGGISRSMFLSNFDPVANSDKKLENKRMAKTLEIVEIFFIL